MMNQNKTCKYCKYPIEYLRGGWAMSIGVGYFYVCAVSPTNHHMNRTNLEYLEEIYDKTN